MMLLIMVLLSIVTGILCGVFGYQADNSKNIHDALLVGLAGIVLWPFIFVIAFMLWENENRQQKM